MVILISLFVSPFSSLVCHFVSPAWLPLFDAVYIVCFGVVHLGPKTSSNLPGCDRGRN